MVGMKRCRGMGGKHSMRMDGNVIAANVGRSLKYEWLMTLIVTMVTVMMCKKNIEAWNVVCRLC